MGRETSSGPPADERLGKGFPEEASLEKVSGWEHSLPHWRSGGPPNAGGQGSQEARRAGKLSVPVPSLSLAQAPVSPGRYTTCLEGQENKMKGVKKHTNLLASHPRLP